MKINKIRSLQDLADKTHSLYSYGERRLWWFRGHRDAAWKLLPKVKRGYPDGIEQSLANHFYTRAPSRHVQCPDVNDLPGWISLMQHYGLPTRLLDWTRSPLIAAHFAIHSFRSARNIESLAPACIWAINPLEFNDSQGFEPYAMPLNANTLNPLIRPFLKGGSETGNIAAALSIEQDARMHAQQGAFTIHSASKPLEEIEGCEKWLKKFIIEPEAANKMAWDIKMLGIDSSYVFPDLEALAAEIVDTFAP